MSNIFFNCLNIVEKTLKKIQTRKMEKNVVFSAETHNM